MRRNCLREREKHKTVSNHTIVALISLSSLQTSAEQPPEQETKKAKVSSSRPDSFDLDANLFSWEDIRSMIMLKSLVLSRKIMEEESARFEEEEKTSFDSRFRLIPNDPSLRTPDGDQENDREHEALTKKR